MSATTTPKGIGQVGASAPATVVRCALFRGEPGVGVPEVIRLRRFLKVLLRELGGRCLATRWVAPAPVAMYAIVVRVDPATVSLRRLLREFGFRCIVIRAVTPPPASADEPQEGGAA